MNDPILRLESASCRFGSVAALRSVNLAIARGDRIALVGPSGAGKSTLLSLLNGSLCPSEGNVWILGKSIQSLRTRERRKIQRQIGTVYQQHNLVGNLAVIHNVNAGHLGRWPLWKALLSLVWPQNVTEVCQVLRQLGLEDKLYARTKQLSGGQQQRVALARVFVQDPAIVLADEPVASVDPARAHSIMDRLMMLGQSRTLVVSLHDIDIARTYCDRIVGLREGRILFNLPSAEVSDRQLSALYDLSVAA